ncbi:MAG: 23S rRNA (guanosine(2251)-2'-O)-methyltransferase RlmB [Anaerolineales bacterium]|nr:23S rRNA (guanosine(2251)-2'-O)-methyltransferase RlmB [Anaerolineales bacterium]
MSGPSEWVCGRNAVAEVLRAGRRRMYRVWILETADRRGPLDEFLQAARALAIPIEPVPRQALDGLGAHHQGVAAEVEPYPYVGLDEVCRLAAERREPLFVLLLDMIQDPQNLGSLLRTAEAVGVHGVVIPPRRSAGITDAVVRASAGACEHMLVAQGNLVQAIERVRRQGAWVFGLEAGLEAVPLREVRLTGPLGLVVGNEGQGMRRLVRQACDQLVRLPMRGQVASLNAAIAGSVALYAVWAAREGAGEAPAGAGHD